MGSSIERGEFMIRYAQLMLLGLLGFSAAAQQPTIGNCTVLPADSIWNTHIDQLPVSANSATWVNTIGSAKPLHPDFGSGTYNGAPIGIPFVTVPGTQTKYPATFTYADESDPGPYAIPLNAPIEGGSQSTGDRHAIAIDTGTCILYELYAAYPQSAGWTAGSGAIFNLFSDALRPSGLPRLMPPGSRSSRACFVTMRSLPARSATPYALLFPRLGTPSFGPPAITLPR